MSGAASASSTRPDGWRSSDFGITSPITSTTMAAISVWTTRTQPVGSASPKRTSNSDRSGASSARLINVE